MVNSANNEQCNCSAQKIDRKGIPVIAWIADLYPVYIPYDTQKSHHYIALKCVVTATSPQSTPVVERDIQVPMQVMCLDGVVMMSELNENEQELTGYSTRIWPRSRLLIWCK